MTTNPRTAATPDRSPHPTATLLLDTTVALLETEPMSSLSLAMVLERSGVSHGSLYHHYADFPDLVEQAVVYRFSRGLQEGQVLIRSLLDATDAADLRARAEAVFAELGAPRRRRNRMDQVEALGAVQSRPRLAERLASAQHAITDERRAVIAELQRRGWVRGDLDPTALADFSQGMVMGAVVGDVNAHPADPKARFDVALVAFRAMFFGD